MSEQQQARILIAEDEANLRLVLQKELERLGYRVQAAPDGEAALRRLEESNVDVLLCESTAWSCCVVFMSGQIRLRS